MPARYILPRSIKPRPAKVLFEADLQAELAEVRSQLAELQPRVDKLIERRRQLEQALGSRWRRA